MRKFFALSKYDCCRANKATAAWGLEARVPFLDKEFLDYAMSIDPTEKMCPCNKMEKGILREAFQGYPSRRDPLASERAILRRRRLQLDRLSKTSRGGTDHERNDGARRLSAFPSRRQPRKKAISIERFSTAFQKSNCVSDRSCWALDCLFDADGFPMVPGVRENGRSVGQSG